MLKAKISRRTGGSARSARNVSLIPHSSIGKSTQTAGPGLLSINRRRNAWPLPYSVKPSDTGGIASVRTVNKGTPAFNENAAIAGGSVADEAKRQKQPRAHAQHAAGDAAHEEVSKRKTAPVEEGSTTDSVKVYFSNIRRFSLLTSREEKELATKIARGDQEARRRMIESNLRLVINIAKRYISRGLPLQDLIEEGNIGLIKSVERFKAAKGCKFSTYATYWIKQAIERAITNQSGIVRLPIHVTADMARISKASRELQTTLKREPSLTELSEKTGLSGRYVKKLNSISKKSYSLNASFPDDPDQSFLDMLEDDKIPDPAERIDESRKADRINGLLGALDSNESTILRLRFGLDDDEPQTLDAIGRSFGVTRERVRQIEVKALSKLRKAMQSAEIPFEAV